MLTSVPFPCEVIQIDLQTLLISHKDTVLGSWHLQETNAHQCFWVRAACCTQMYQIPDALVGLTWDCPAIPGTEQPEKKKRQSDNNLVERSDAQRCREFKWLADGHPLTAAWITPKMLFSSVIKAAELLSLSTKTLDKMPSMNAQITEPECSLCLHREMTASPLVLFHGSCSCMPNHSEP